MLNVELASSEHPKSRYTLVNCQFCGLWVTRRAFHVETVIINRAERHNEVAAGALCKLREKLVCGWDKAGDANDPRTR